MALLLTLFLTLRLTTQTIQTTQTKQPNTNRNLIIKTFRSSFLVCGLVFSLAPTITAADQPAVTPSDRVDGRYWTEVRPERLVTTCTPFAKDYPRPPRVLFLVPGLLGPREVSELDQRFNMQFDVMLYHGPWTTDALGQSNMYTAAIAGSTQEEQLARLLKLLAATTYDAIVFGHNVSFDGLSPRAKYEVLKQVAGGTGLVLLKPFPQPELPGKYPAQFANGPQPLTEAEILAGVPIEMIPIQAGLIGAGADLIRITRATMAGKGRVVWLNSAGSDDGNVNVGTRALTPYMSYRLEEDVLYDQSLSAVAKAILAAIPTKVSPVIPDVANARVMDVPFASVPGSMTIGSFACPLPLTVQMSVVNLLGDRIALPPV